MSDYGPRQQSEVLINLLYWWYDHYSNSLYI